LACLGIGASGSTEAINDLVPLLEDRDDDVQLAAALALGAIGNDEALEALVIAFTEGSEQLRQAVAEAMAALPEDGFPILFDAISHDDMMVRRAATYGLRRLGARWTKDALYRAFLEDEQWYVRSAAQQAFHDLQEQEGRGPERYPEVGEIPWLVSWATEHGENVPAGEAASQVLYNALSAGDGEIRMMAARTLGQLGEINAAKSLYATLRDRQDDVRIAAYQSLADLEMQLGQPLPAPA
jgi:HEAT repeat protein